VYQRLHLIGLSRAYIPVHSEIDRSLHQRNYSIHTSLLLYIVCTLARTRVPKIIYLQISVLRTYTPYPAYTTALFPHLVSSLQRLRYKKIRHGPVRHPSSAPCHGIILRLGYNRYMHAFWVDGSTEKWLT